MHVYIKWDETNGWMESEVKIRENEFVLGEVYFENENYKLIAHSKRYEEYFFVAEWKK